MNLPTFTFTSPNNLLTFLYSHYLIIRVIFFVYFCRLYFKVQTSFIETSNPPIYWYLHQYVNKHSPSYKVQSLLYTLRFTNNNY